MSDTISFHERLYQNLFPQINKVTGNNTGFVKYVQKLSEKNMTYAESVFSVDISPLSVYDCIKGTGYLIGNKAGFTYNHET